MFKHINVKSQFAADRTKSIYWMLGRCFAFSLMSICFAFISKDIGAFQVFFLSIIARFLLLTPPVFFTQGFNLSTKYAKTYLVRAMLTTFGFASYIAALKHISLNEVTAISYTAPLFTSVFAAVILGEKLSTKRILALLCGFSGAMIIIRPDIRIIELGTTLAMATAMLWSLGDIVVKIQANTNEKLGTQLFWSTLFMILFSLPLASAEYFYFGFQVIPNNSDWLWIFAAGAFILLTNLALFLSCRFSDIAFLMPFSFSKLIFTAILAYFAFGDVLSMSQVSGSCIIIASTVYLVRAERSGEAKKI